MRHRAPVTISASQPFGLLSTQGDVSFTFTVSGGDTPYELRIDWGDSLIDTVTLNTPGTYTFTHTYQKKKNYTATLTAKDKNGVVSEVSIPFVQVKGQSSSGPLGFKVTNNNSGLERYFRPLLIGLALLLTLLILLDIRERYDARRRRLAITKKPNKRSNKR